MRTRSITSGLLMAALSVAASIPAAAPAWGWSLLDEVTIVEPGLTADLVWEMINTKTYCESGPPGLDRLACAIAPDPGEIWIGLDAAGNGYGTVNGADFSGEYFDIYRRPAGTKVDQHLVRITKRIEPVFGQVTKLFVASRWEVDLTAGTMLIGLSGSCFSAACASEGDTTDHLAQIRISGLPTLFDLALTYVPAGAISFNVPARPEGLPTADRIDVYYGDTASLPDLSAAQPLACNAAAGASAGDIVQVADPLPAPAVGHARYYMTAVTSGADRRAGRQSIAGTLSGRQAASLPTCP